MLSQIELDSLVEKGFLDSYKTNFRNFYKNVGFNAIFPGKTLIETYVTDYLCEVCEASFYREKEYRKVIINIPPGLMKSTIISGALPAWVLGNRPQERIFGISNTDELVKRNIDWTKLVIENNEFKKIFPTFELKKDTQTHIQTYFGGERKGFSTLGGITGERCDLMLVDDYMNTKMLLSDAERTRALTLWAEGFESRIDSNGCIIIIEQRLDPRDLTGYILRTRKDEYTHIKIPAYFEEKKYYYIEYNRKLNNNKSEKIKFEMTFNEGDLLSPEIITQKKINDLKNRIIDSETGIANGKFVFYAQYLQDPISKDGNLVQIDWFLTSRLIDFETMIFDYIIVSVDSAQKAQQINDPSCFHKYGIIKNKPYLIDRYSERKLYPETKENLINFLNNGHKANFCLIEDKNTGSSLLQELKNESKCSFVRFVPIEPGITSKELRFSTATGYMSKGIYVPKDAHWYPEFESQMIRFPKAPHDDDADACAQFCNYMTNANFFNNIDNLIFSI